MPQFTEDEKNFLSAVAEGNNNTVSDTISDMSETVLLNALEKIHCAIKIISKGRKKNENLENDLREFREIESCIKDYLEKI